MSTISHPRQQEINEYLPVAEHPWVREDGVAPDVAIDPTVLKKLKEFSAMNRLKKAALMVIKTS